VTRRAIAALCLVGAAAGQQPKPAPPKQPPPDPWLVKVAKFFGVSSTPPTILRDSETVRAGQIWIGSVPDATSRVLAAETDYRSPIFSSNGSQVYALRRGHLVRLDPRGGAAAEVLPLPDAFKLVGASGAEGEEILLIQRREGAYSVWTLAVASGRLTEIHGIEKDAPAMYALLGKERVYGDVRFETGPAQFDDLTGPTERENVFYYASPSGERRQLTKCSDAECTDPSLSPGGGSFVYIRRRPH